MIVIYLFLVYLFFIYYINSVLMFCQICYKSYFDVKNYKYENGIINFSDSWVLYLPVTKPNCILVKTIGFNNQIGLLNNNSTFVEKDIVNESMYVYVKKIFNFNLGLHKKVLFLKSKDNLEKKIIFSYS